MRMLLSTLLVAVLAGAASSAEPPLHFETHVLPILETRCLRCHGEGKVQGGLDLRRKFTLLKGGDNGPSIVPGKPDDSLLIQKIDKNEMPPAKEEALTARQKEILKKWVAAGAPLAQATEKPLQEKEVVIRVKDEDRRFWSFQPAVRPAVPQLRNSKSEFLARNPIDTFLLVKLQEKGLAFNAEAPREVLIRRLFFTMTGLPPTLAERATALSDPSPHWYEELVDRLLASPHYGERWGRYWLDLAGYADSDGYLDADRLRPQAWRYRDYVIQALNADMPYDQFLTEQLAGDELSDWRRADELTPAMLRQLTATGFLRNALDPTYPGYTEPNEIHQVVNDTMQIVSTTFLGLTVQCARCHAHKYDPVSQKDYYALQTVFLPALDPARWQPSEVRGITAASEKQLAIITEHNRKVDEKIKPLQTKLNTLIANKKPPYPAEIAPEVQKLQAAISQVQAQKKPVPPLLRGLRDQEGKVPDGRILIRGDHAKPGGVVAASVPEVLAPVGFKFEAKEGYKTSGRRLALAQWLTDPKHPLTARVQMNRMWAHYFGRGLVPTVANLGRSGAKPSHPELLDWLATEFVARGWSMKKMHGLMLTSTAFRQSSAVDPAKLKVDPENALLSRWRPRRLEGEAVRDNVLAVSGKLQLQAYGTPAPVARQADGSVASIDDAQGNRRSIYLSVRRSLHLTFLDLFDTPLMEVNCPERNVSTVPLQALALLHSPFSNANAEALADQILKTVTTNDRERIGYAFRLVFGREPKPSEAAKIEKYITVSVEEDTRGKAAGASAGLRGAWVQVALVLLNSSEFVYVS